MVELLGLNHALSALAQADLEGSVPAVHLYRSLLQECMKKKDLAEARQVHSHLAKHGLESNKLLGNLAVTTLVTCGGLGDGLCVFYRLSHRSVFAWTAIISGYSNAGLCRQALVCYQQMQLEGELANKYTFVSVLKACSRLGDLEEGRRVHDDARRRGLESDVFVGNTLVSMYAKCGSISDAQKVFDTLSTRDVVSWNAILGAYAQQERSDLALQLYGHMRRSGVRPDDRTFVSVLQACGSQAEREVGARVHRQDVKVESLHKGKELHAQAVELGYGSDVFVGSTLVSVYAKCGSIEDAQKVFDGLSKRDVVLWRVMMVAYVGLGHWEKALHIYKKMREEGMGIDEATVLYALQACSCTGALDVCKHVQKEILESGLASNLVVANSLIHTFGKCGSMVDAHKVFDSLTQPDVVSCTALIAGYARQGDVHSSVQCFANMTETGVKPNRVTFLAILSACCNAGLVARGLQYFETMAIDHGISPELEHYACVIDLVARAGLFSKAESIISEMPMQPDLRVWLSLLGACRKHSNVELGKRAFESSVTLEPERASAYLMMCNIYSEAGMWEHAKDVDELRRRAGAWKQPAQSWIELRQEVRTFFVGDNRHHRPQEEAPLYSLLRSLNKQLQRI